ncbi:MAG: hypothetical protein EB829_00435 [Nitrosopumilus sp. H8]|nr:MAG: hypothetical protein EB829_00435 [Nitrosopumilus sp. H8]
MRITYVCAALVLVALPAAHADEIPDWVRDIATFWSQGQISDAEFVRAIQYLAENGVITIPNTYSEGSETAELPFRITSEHTMSDSGTCEIVIRGISGYDIDAVTDPPGVMCDIRVYDEAKGSMVGGISVEYDDGTSHTIYSPWNPFEGDVSAWHFDPGNITYMEIVFHDTTGSYADDYGTIFFDRNGIHLVQIALN